MFEEDDPRITGANDIDRMDLMHEDEIARERVFDQTNTKFEGAF